MIHGESSNVFYWKYAQLRITKNFDLFYYRQMTTFSLPDHKTIYYLPHDEYRLISAMYDITTDGLYSAYYKRYLDDQREFIKSQPRLIVWYNRTRNAYYDQAISNWCKIFGSWSEPTHYYKLLEIPLFVTKLKEIFNIKEKNDLKHMIVNNVNMEEFKLYHSKTKDYRDRYLIHREHSPKQIEDDELGYPNLDVPIKTFCSIALFLIRLTKSFPQEKLDSNQYALIMDNFEFTQQIFLFIKESFQSPFFPS